MKLFLFDFDGVLVESLNIYEKTVTTTLEKVNKPLTGGREEFLELFEDNFYASLIKKGVDLKKFVAASVDVLDKVDYTTMQPVAGIIPVLRKLQENNILLVISSNNTKTIQRALTRFKSDELFQEVLGSDFLLSKRDKIKYVTDKYQIAPADVYYIGDTTGDIKESKQAGVKTIGITWGWHSKEKITSAAPDYVFEQPNDLLQLN
ncbi:MAG TPA: HAD family hydrolase [Smithellaceae bacterium]|nr:HAD family hydrolase [Smithellaceae bacterium]